MSTTASGQSERGIGSIAHLFLSKTNGVSSSKRRPPGTSERTSNVNAHEDTDQQRPVESQSPHPAGAVRAGACGIATGAKADPAIDLSPSERRCIVDADLDGTSRPEETDAASASCVVFTKCDPDDLIDAYRTIKWLAGTSSGGLHVSLLVCDAPNEVSGREAFERLSRTSEKFLSLQIHSAGCHLRNTSGNPIDMLTLLPTQHDGRRYIIMDDTQSVRQPGEKDEQTAANVGAGASSIGGPTSGDTPSANTQTVRRPLAVDHLPTDDESLSRMLQWSVRHWLTALPAAAVVPAVLPADLDDSLAILVDREGRVHIMACGLEDTASLWQGSLIGRKWLTDNVSLVAQACPQFRIDPALEPGLLLVSAADAKPLTIAAEQVSNFPVIVMRLHLLQNEHGTSLLLI